MSVLAISAAHADCKETFHAVDVGDQPMRLRSFDCRTDDGPSAASFRIEFHRLSDAAASLIFTGQSSTILKQTIGSPKVIESGAQKTYLDLLNRFGRTHEVESNAGFGNRPRFKMEGPGGQTVAGVRDTLSTEQIRTLDDIYLSWGAAPLYPLIDELQVLRRRTIPDGLKFFFAADCEDSDLRSEDDSCKKYSRQKFSMKFWRGLQPVDVVKYQERARAYNRLMQQARRRDYEGKVIDIVPPDLKMAQYMGGDAWPDDFIIAIGEQGSTDECGSSIDGPQITGWAFAYWPRKVLVDVVLVENTSNRPVTVGGLLGTTTSATNLRVAAVPAVVRTTTRAVEMSEPLGAGERLLIATRVAFVPNGLFRMTTPDLGQRSSEFFARVGTNGFRGARSGHSAPSFKNYVFGPEMNVGGFVVNGTAVALNRRASSNFGDLIVSRETGSCPFLMSWNEDRREWTDHGKVLDKAPGRDLQYSELKVFPGFKRHFRIEEREPEIASIDQAELTVMLRNGEKRRLLPDHVKLAALDGAYLQLYFGEAIDIEYKLPEDISPEDVTESELRLTGYYERYSALMAGNEKKRWRLLRARSANGSASVERAAACPVPGLPSAPRGL